MNPKVSKYFIDQKNPHGYMSSNNSDIQAVAHNARESLLKLKLELLKCETQMIKMRLLIENIGDDLEG